MCHRSGWDKSFCGSGGNNVNHKTVGTMASRPAFGVSSVRSRGGGKGPVYPVYPMYPQSLPAASQPQPNQPGFCLNLDWTPDLNWLRPCVPWTRWVGVLAGGGGGDGDLTSPPGGGGVGGN